ncbi:MAG: stage II sporulation protein R [Clostridiales bacterium]|nr:stage II sporulation protein R [Clostridiales bacterium]
MKIFIKSACAAFVLTVIYSLIPFQAECADISDEVFRLHILANSDSTDDQNLKLKVRDRVLEYTEDLFENAQSREEAEALVSENLQSITNVAYEEVLSNGYDYTVTSEITNMYFTTRYYDSYTLPPGMYDALRITIGEGEGCNWWCVMYPSICISSAQEQEDKAKEVFDDEQYDIVTSNDYEYKFKIVEIFEKISSTLSKVL